jgi:uncharacterized protein YndB with AHSA1/START domain
MRRLLRLAVVGGLAAVLVDRWLAARRGAAGPDPLRMLAVVEAPVERTWALVSDVPRQPEWMHEMKAVRMDDTGPPRPGSRGEATVRVFGISVTDPVTITEVEPPRRFAIRHEGLFAGGGLITLRPGADGTTTIVDWEETLVPPLLPELGALVQTPILRRIFQDDLLRLKRLVEGDGSGSPLPTVR